jgi:hypothetical protein
MLIPPPPCLDPYPCSRLLPAPLSRSCLLSKCYSGAGAALEADVYCVDPRRTAVTPTDVLLYCYYGALLEIGRWGARLVLLFVHSMVSGAWWLWAA